MNKLDGEVYNIGTGVDTLLTDVYYKIAMILGKDNAPILKEERKGEIKLQCLDSSKLRALGWKPQWDLHHGMNQTIEWYVNHRSWWEKIPSCFWLPSCP